MISKANLQNDEEGKQLRAQFSFVAEDCCTYKTGEHNVEKMLTLNFVFLQ